MAHFNDGNQYAVGNNGGRPALYETTEALIERIDSYFEYIKGEKTTEVTEGGDMEAYTRNPEPATVTGLVLYLGFSSRSSMVDYEKRNNEFSHIIRKARLRVEHEYEKALHYDKPTGAIFALKNMGWADRTEIDHTTKGGPIGGDPDLSNYTDDELRTLAELQRKGRISEA